MFSRVFLKGFRSYKLKHPRVYKGFIMRKFKRINRVFKGFRAYGFKGVWGSKG